MFASTELEVIRTQVEVRLRKIESILYVVRELYNEKAPARKPALRQKLWDHVRHAFCDKSPGALPDIFAVAVQSKAKRPAPKWFDRFQKINLRRTRAADLPVLNCVARVWCQVAGSYRTELSQIFPKPLERAMRRKPDVLGSLAPLRFEPLNEAVVRKLDDWTRCTLKEEGGIPARTPDALLGLLKDSRFQPIWPDMNAAYERLEDCCRRFRGKRLAPNLAQAMRAAIQHVKMHQPPWLDNDGQITAKAIAALEAGETEPPFRLSPGEVRRAVASAFGNVAVSERLINDALRKARKIEVLKLCRIRYIEPSVGLMVFGSFYHIGNGIAEDVPVWDPRERSLFFRDKRLKKYRPNAKNQMLVLNAFQKYDWAPCIDDPLPRSTTTSQLRALNFTISNLNRTLSRIEFRGSGTRICWQAAPQTKRKK